MTLDVLGIASTVVSCKLGPKTSFSIHEVKKAL